MSNIKIVYGPNRYKFNYYLESILKELPSSIAINRFNLTLEGAKYDDFVHKFSTRPLFNLLGTNQGTSRFFIVEVFKDNLLALVSDILDKVTDENQIIIYCPDLSEIKVKEKTKSKGNSKSTKSDIDYINTLKKFDNLKLKEAYHIYDIDDARSFCHSLIKSYNINFKSDEDLELTVEHLVSSSQLTLDSNGELAFIDCDTELENIIYEQNFIDKNIIKLAAYSSNLDELEFEEIESLIFSTVHKTNSKYFMKKLFKCSNSREASKLLSEELSSLNNKEIRTFIGSFRNLIEQYLKKTYGERYVGFLVEPITKGNLKIVRPDDVYIELCDLSMDYMCTNETYINRLKLCLYKNFK